MCFERARVHACVCVCACGVIPEAVSRVSPVSFLKAKPKMAILGFRVELGLRFVTALVWGLGLELV